MRLCRRDAADVPKSAPLELHRLLLLQKKNNRRAQDDGDVERDRAEWPRAEACGERVVEELVAVEFIGSDKTTGRSLCGLLFVSSLV